MAGLNFPGNAVYWPEEPGRDNVTPFEFIPWVLGRCATVAEARVLLDRLNLWGVPFRPELPLAPLHWMISDRSGSITVESVKEGLQVYDNPAEVLTNNPPFDYQMTNLSNYLNLTPWEPENHFSSQLDLTTYCKGMGALGLPGDLSSVSRFVRAAFTRLNAVSGPSEAESVSQFFHILGSVAQSRGCVRLCGRSWRSGRRPVRNHRLLLLLQHGSWHLLLHHLRQPSDYRRGPPRGKPGGNPSCVLSPRHRTANPSAKREQNLEKFITPRGACAVQHRQIY